MLTRIEIDGFKNLLGFSAEFGPFTCIAGPNAVGKSNLFDAIEFLSLLAEHPIKDAARRVRGDGEIVDLFWTNGAQRADRIRFAVELLVPAPTPSAFCRYRYELELALVDSSDFPGVRQIALAAESLREVEGPLRFPGSQFVRIVPDPSDGVTTFSFRGVSPLHKYTMLSSQIGDENHREVAVRNTFRSWQRLALEPEELRRPDSIDDIEADVTITSSGRHLPATMYRLAHQSHDGHPPDPGGFYARLAVCLSDLVNLRQIAIDRDDKHGLVSLDAVDSNGGRFPARALSDGTLRFLALATLSFDRRQRLLCVEEPENGIHPARMSALVELLRDLGTGSFNDSHEDESTLRQVIVNTHSPALVSEIYKYAPEDLLLASSVLVRRDPGYARVLRMHPIGGTWRCTEDVRGVNLPIVDYVGTAARPWQLAGVAEDK